MRSLAGLAGFVLLLCGGCSKEPTFDESFNQHSADIEAHADKIQTELSNQLNASSAEVPTGTGDASVNGAAAYE